MKSRRAQGISINMIIVAAIALIVLVVLVAIFTGRMGNFGRQLTGQENRYCGPVPDNAKGIGTTVKGVVGSETNGCTAPYVQVYGAFSDVPYGSICCVQQATN